MEQEQSIDQVILEITAGFAVDLLNEFAHEIGMRNTEATYVFGKYKPVVGGKQNQAPDRLTKVPLTTTEEFSLQSAKSKAVIKKRVNGNPDISLNFVPRKPSDLQHVMIDAGTTDCGSFFDFYFLRRPDIGMNLWEVIEKLKTLKMKGRSDGITYGALLNRMIEIEKRKRHAELLDSHPNFGDW